MADTDFKAIAARQRAAIEELYRSLKQADFGFEKPREAFLPPSPDTEKILQRFAANGCPLPEAVAEFYRQIGGVNFIGWSSDWDDDEYPDALNVDTLELLLENFEECYLEDRAAMDEAYGGFYLSFCPDFLHKQDISGGEAYGFVLPTKDADPKVNGIPWDFRFTEYIDFAIENGGFPGIGFWRYRIGGDSARDDEDERR
ncbi:MAG: hypothetical protein V4773_03550 [Verrucomicrobiota bacterium]